MHKVFELDTFVKIDWMLTGGHPKNLIGNVDVG
jgi:hypothetical protein